MATDEERLVLRLEAQVSKFERQLKKANGTANRQAGRIEKRFERMNSNLNRSFKNALRGAVPTIAVGVLVSEFTRLTDASKRVENALKVTGLEGKALEAVYDNLFASAQKNFVPLEALVELYSKAALVQKELGVTTQELTEFTDNVSLALRVSGKSASESSGALLQLSQALGSGVVRAEEFNSILEGAPTIAQAVAAGLEEAGGSVAKLRGLVIDGKISSEAFFRAFEAGAPSLASKVANAEVTASQALTRLQNQLIKSVARFDGATGASASFVQGIEVVTDSLPAFTTFAVNLSKQISSIGSQFDAAQKSAINFAASLGNKLGTDKIGQFVLNETGGFGDFLKRAGFSSTRDTSQQERQIKSVTSTDRIRYTPEGVPYEGFKSPDDFRNNLSGKPVKVEVTNPAKEDEKLDGIVNPVSLKSFASPNGKASGGGGRSKAAKKNSTGGGSSSRQNEFAREIEQIQKRTELIKAETAAQAGLNPLIDDYGFAVEKARQVQELLSAAKEAGVKVTPELRAKIEGLATAYAKASSDAIILAESQEKVREKAEEFKEFGKDITKGLISDLREGKSAAEAFENALDKIADKLIDMAVNNLFESAFGAGGIGGGASGGGGFLSSIFKSISSFDGGGRTRSGSRTGGLDGKGGYMAMVHPNETIIDHTKGGGVKMPVMAAKDSSQSIRVYVEPNDDRFNAYVDQRSKKTSARVVGQAAPNIVDASVSETNTQISNGNFDKSMSRFGSKPQPRQVG